MEPVLLAMFQRPCREVVILLESRTALFAGFAGDSVMRDGVDFASRGWDDELVADNPLLLDETEDDCVEESDVELMEPFDFWSDPVEEGEREDLVTFRMGASWTVL